MPLYRDKAIVLHTRKLGEADKIITLLTENNGKVDAVAKSIRKTKSRFGSTLEPFAHLEIQMYTGKNLDTITQTKALHSFGFDLSTNYELYTIANAMSETLNKLVQEKKEPVLDQYTLYLGALNTLSSLSKQVDEIKESEASLSKNLITKKGQVILNSYILRALDIAGWKPMLDQCAACGSSKNLSGFSFFYGGVVCEKDKTNKDIKISKEEQETLIKLAEGSWQGIPLQSITYNLNSIISAYLHYHLECKIKSFRHIK